MKYREESLATDLHRALTRRLANSTTLLTIKGAGVNWSCRAECGDSNCEIACSAALGTEYYCRFVRNAEVVATSRSALREETIDAVKAWLDGDQLADLYSRFDFVDKAKRSLTNLRDAVFRAIPLMAQTVRSDIQCELGDHYRLRFQAETRACEVSYYGKDQFPDAKFSWDDCELFAYQPHDSVQLARVLMSWLREQAAPSRMRTEFPWLSIGTLADYYESGNPIEGEFLQSWDGVEEFYGRGSFAGWDAILGLIRTMRSAGYDRVLRAGTSLWSLGLSRSRRHGLRDGQPVIWLNFGPTFMDVKASFTRRCLAKHAIRLTDDVRILLDELVEFEIN